MKYFIFNVKRIKKIYNVNLIEVNLKTIIFD
jgi:hypothetical protein